LKSKGPLVETRAEGEDRRLIVMPNASLTTAQALWFLGGMALVCFGIAGVFAGMGYWLVLPFAGLEVLALAAGLYWAMRGNAYREVISVGEERVRIEVGRRHPEWSWEFPRAWARVWLENAQSPCDHGHLLIAYAGQRCEIGAFLCEEDRVALAGRLQQLVAKPRHGWLAAHS
jgi:uncharacterized membrane protein